MISPNRFEELAREFVTHGLIGMRVEERLFAVPVRVVREINPPLTVTPVRRAPPAVRGLANLRGQVVTLIDLGVLLGSGPLEITDSSRLVILKTNAELGDLLDEAFRTSEDKIGLLIDEVIDVIKPCRQEVEPRPSTLGAHASSHALALCKLATVTVGILALKDLIAGLGARAPAAQLESGG